MAIPIPVSWRSKSSMMNTSPSKPPITSVETSRLAWVLNVCLKKKYILVLHNRGYIGVVEGRVIRRGEVPHA
jgi:hypothetical protein